METWKDIKGYEGMYQVSSMGKVKSLDRLDNKGRKTHGKVLAIKHDGGGYCQVALSKDGSQKYCKIHRLVALHFIPNTENKPQINHKDENKDNNAVDNLEWVTSKENANYGTRKTRCYQNRDYKAIGRNISQGIKEKGHCRAVVQYDLSMNKLAEFETIVEAGKALHILPSGIGNAVRGNCQTYKGFIWKYKEVNYGKTGSIHSADRSDRSEVCKAVRH